MIGRKYYRKYNKKNVGTYSLSFLFQVIAISATNDNDNESFRRIIFYLNDK